MKRSSFLVASILGLAGLSAYSFIKALRVSGRAEALAQPRFLSRLCDRNTIQQLGGAYLKMKPEETGSDILLSELLTRKSQRVSPGKKDLSSLESEIERQIKQDFESDHVVLVQGWVLSITEARQCAYFSILNE